MFGDFLPSIQKVLCFASLAIPALNAKEGKEREQEMVANALLSQHSQQNIDVIRNISKSNDGNGSTYDLMLAFGQNIGSQRGYNPVEMMAQLLGEEEMSHILSEIAQASERFPGLTEEQLILAQQVCLFFCNQRG
jgi:hypothetical protein